MKIFAVRNDKSESDFDIKDNFLQNGSSNRHSGGIVIIAETLVDAQNILLERGLEGTLTEVPLRAGVVIQADGDC